MPGHLWCVALSIGPTALPPPSSTRRSAAFNTGNVAKQLGLLLHWNCFESAQLAAKWQAEQANSIKIALRQKGEESIRKIKMGI